MSNRRLRLIHSGRLLADDTLLYSWLKALEDRQKRVLEYEDASGASEKSPLSPTDGPTPNQNVVKNSPVWLHCSVGAELPSGGAEEDKVADVSPTLHESLIQSIILTLG